MLPPTHETRLQHEATASSNGHSMPPPTHETRLQHETAASSNAPDTPPVMSSSRRILALITSHSKQLYADGSQNEKRGSLQEL